jgi:hypothetical protein
VTIRGHSDRDDGPGLIDLGEEGAQAGGAETDLGAPGGRRWGRDETGEDARRDPESQRRRQPAAVSPLHPHEMPMPLARSQANHSPRRTGLPRSTTRRHPGGVAFLAALRARALRRRCDVLLIVQALRGIVRRRTRTVIGSPIVCQGAFHCCVRFHAALRWPAHLRARRGRGGSRLVLPKIH